MRQLRQEQADSKALASRRGDRQSERRKTKGRKNKGEKQVN
jgi:hypothetical protein